jgi:allantoate deiminase
MTPRAPEHLAATVLERCDALARFSEEDGRLTRRFATPALRAAGDAVEGWMREAGMATRRDAIGNVVGRLEAGSAGPSDSAAGDGSAPAARAAGTLVMGSHLDTVRDAGRFDGPLGVLVGIACAERLREEERRAALEVVAFADEEGVRYGTAYLGSSAYAGRLDPAVLERRDVDGLPMAQALAAVGDDPTALGTARRDPADLLGYLEVHIEQGPVLETEEVPVGVVEAISGQTRAALSFVGRAGHAGTVPMALRRDALAGAAEWIVAVERLARGQEGLVATVGEAHVFPGAGNVVPGRVALSLDVRHREDAVRTGARDRLHETATAIAAERDLTLEWELVQETAAVSCDPALTDALARAVRDQGLPHVRLTSGAGHDAAVLAAITPVAMLFVRCAGGISHHPDESVTLEDVATAVAVAGAFVSRVIWQAGSG